jgi:hypothetical protein
MKTLFLAPVLAVLLFVAPTSSLALRSIGVVTKEQARDMGIVVRATPAGPEAAWVELEFKPQGPLKDFHHVELEANEGEKLLIAYAPLREERKSSGSVVVRFMANRAHLEKITLCIVAGLDAGFDVRLKDFIALDQIR